MSTKVDFLEVHYSTEEEMRAFDPENAARELVQYALREKSNDVFITDEVDRVSIRMKKLGRIELLQYLSKEAGRKLQNHFRAVGGADVTDHVKPVDGREVIELENGVNVDVRLSALPNIFGQDLALRLFHAEQSLLDMDQLGYLEDELGMIRKLLDQNSGLVLVSGPTGSGKTCSLYSFLQYLNKGDLKLHTLEEPVEFILPGIIQSQVNHRMGVGYAELLHAMMRHSPDVLMIGEIRDAKTAEVAVRAGGSGQLVLATVHARTAIGSIQTMLSFGVNSNYLANSLSGVVSQRLIRRLCHACRVAVEVTSNSSEVDASQLQGGQGNHRSFSMPVGCEGCTEGYDQMTCVPEILRVNQVMRQAISERQDVAHLLEVAKGGDFRSFLESARKRLEKHVSTFEELIKVVPDSEMNLTL
ncbi:MAG: ATPase, T2SS/T4P/T4SS family [Planctomycetota bacterium]|nr:ATPase, T2SS/T4P/T4SS family [Planctomycetota bacterium]